MLYVDDTFPIGSRGTLVAMEPFSLADPVIHPSAFVAATARVYGSVEIAAGAVVMFGAVLRAELEQIVIGEESNLQDNVVVHADLGFPTATASWESELSRSTVQNSAKEPGWRPVRSSRRVVRSHPGPWPSGHRRTLYASFGKTRSLGRNPAWRSTGGSGRRIDSSSCRPTAEGADGSPG